jgi:hypothetical protein
MLSSLITPGKNLLFHYPLLDHFVSPVLQRQVCSRVWPVSLIGLNVILCALNGCGCVFPGLYLYVLSCHVLPCRVLSCVVFVFYCGCLVLWLSCLVLTWDYLAVVLSCGCLVLCLSCPVLSCVYLVLSVFLSYLGLSCLAIFVFVLLRFVLPFLVSCVVLV